MHKVLITGASSGIGLAASKLFLERGSSVIMADKAKSDDFDKLKEKYGEKVYFYQGDLTENDTVNPLLRIATPDDVARAMYFLSSDEASYINGTCLPVTGGLEVHSGQPE